MAIMPPTERLWWNEPVEKSEVLWVAVALIWALIMFFMMPYWHVVGRQNLSNEAYRVRAEDFSTRTEAIVAKHTVREEKTQTGSSVPVVHPPAGGDVYIIEANANPELAVGADFAASALKQGISYEELIERILQLGLNRSAS